MPTVGTAGQEKVDWEHGNIAMVTIKLYKRHVEKTFLQNQQEGWRLNHFPGQPVPMLDNPLCEEKFPNIQSKPPLAQLEAISSCPITCYLGEETDPHLSTTSFQVVEESNKVSPQPPFLQAKQSQLPQPLLIRLLLQTQVLTTCQDKPMCTKQFDIKSPKAITKEVNIIPVPSLQAANTTRPEQTLLPKEKRMKVGDERRSELHLQPPSQIRFLKLPSYCGLALSVSASMNLFDVDCQG
ncbi:hypothetical protein QYF61_025321 [Mycteria americana]|uniref:Uncharacterized protein n=1 Tax=Mycteria americana TaxID=33587 RepID=A0AAN7NPX3_MYCAM|nr:hypothetical protein QYF61_025321 [Mycteria americana]